MVYKTSFSRGFKSGLVNPFIIELFLCVVLSIIFIFLSISNNKPLNYLKYSLISLTKPAFVAVSYPFIVTNEWLINISDLKKAHYLNNELKKEIEILKKDRRKVNFYEVENTRLKRLLDITEKRYANKINRDSRMDRLW